MSGSISDIALDLSLSSSQEAAAMAVLNVVAGIGALGAGAVRGARDKDENIHVLGIEVETHRSTPKGLGDIEVEAPRLALHTGFEVASSPACGLVVC
jgi:Na+-translocating ferredoxin:NAD+ oxidoreductase RnfG subunit